MPGRERRTARAAWLIRRDLEELGSDLRAARLAAGLTLREVATSVGVVPSVILGHERAAQAARNVRLARHAAAVGMRVRIRAYPEGEPLRDTAQLALAARFRERLSPSIRMPLEVPVSNEPGDLRAWDAVITVQGCRCGVEFVTRFHDCQAQLRQFQLKLRDGDVERLIVVVKATHANRRALAAAAHVIADAFPLGTRAVLAALAAARAPTQNGLVLL